MEKVVNNRTKVNFFSTIFVLLISLFLFSSNTIAEDLTDEYIYYRLWGYGNDNADYDVDSFYKPFSAEREADITTIGEWWGEPYSNETSTTLALSILDSRFDQYQQWQTQLRLGTGSTGNFNHSILSGGFLGESDFSFMIAFDEQGNDGYIENIYRDTKTIAKNEAQFGRLRLAYDGEMFTSFLQVTQTETVRGDDSFYLSVLPERLSISEIEAYRENKEEASLLNMNWEINEFWNLSSISSYLRTEKVTLQDIDRTPEPLEFFFFESSADLYSQQFVLEHFNKNSEQFSLNIRYTYEESENASVTTGFLLAPVFNGQVWLALLEVEEIFKLDFQLKKEWFLSRDGYLAVQLEYQEYELERAEIDLASADGLVDEDDILRIEFVNPKFDQWTALFLFDYPISDEASLSIDFDQDFRPGGVSLNLVSGKRRFYKQQLESRIDISVYSTDEDFDLNYSVNMFYSNFKNIQVPVFGNRQNPFDVGIINAESATASGIEFELDYMPTDNFKLGLDSVYQQTKYHSFPRAFRTLNGNQFIFEPKLSLTANMLWQINNDWILSFQQIYQGGRFSDAENVQVDKIPSSNISNIKLGYEKESWAVYVWGANITDELDLLYKSTDSDLGIAGIKSSWGLTFEAVF